MARVKNLQDRFSVEDIELATRVRSTFNSGYSRIALASQGNNDIFHTMFDVVDRNAHINAPVECISLKFFYAIMVFHRAVQMSYSKKQFVPYWNLKWGGSKPFYQLVQYGSTRRNTIEKSIAAFWNLLKNVTYSREIKVYEHFRVNPMPTKYSEFFFDPQNSKYLLVLKDIDLAFQEDIVTDLFTYPYDTTPVTFTWEEIKDYFVELTLDQLTLTMPHLVHRHACIDDLLFEACCDSNPEAIRAAISLGADVNALTEQGESALQLLIQTYEDEDDVIKLIDVLLDAGADIDLFGFDGVQPITSAFFRGAVKIVRHLLERGSNPNYNSYLTDGFITEYDKNLSCSILGEMHTKEGFDCLADTITPEMLQIKDLVIQHGGKLFRDDAVWTEMEDEESDTD